MSRGQVSAPIELFVAVIIMSLSIALALYVYSQASDAQCNYRIRSQNERLQEALQEVAISSWGTSKQVDYTMERCGSRPIEGVRFVHLSNPNYCRRCPGNYGGCWVIEPLTYDPQSGVLATLVDSSVCVNLAEALTLEQDPDPACNIPVTNTACPEKIRGVPVSDCYDKVSRDISQAIYSSAGPGVGVEMSTFGKERESNSAFLVRLSKSESSGAAGQAGRLLICAMQES